MRVLQVCNVSRREGGTGACAWSIVRALPDCEHVVVFLSPASAAVRQAFQPARVESHPRVDAELVRRLAPDVVLLHNTSPSRCPERLPGWTVHYAHSVGAAPQADQYAACSRWLQERMASAAARCRLAEWRQPAVWRRAFETDAAACQPVEPRGPEERRVVLYQPVTTPPRPAGGDARELRDSLLIGRLCTPTRAKWPMELIPFYAELARRRPDADWEFVGCPVDLQPELQRALDGRARFLAAGWEARSHLWRWDVLLYHHPTLTESFGRTAAEAMRAGCVPVVDNRGGFCEQVAPGTGRLCAGRAEFQDALAELSDCGERRQYSQRAREHADAWFSLAQFRSELLQLLLRGPDRGRPGDG